jgi:hypothetical protein
LHSIASYVRFYSIQRRLDRLEKGIQDVEGAPTPFVAVLACFQVGHVDKGDGIAARAHEDLKKLISEITSGGNIVAEV